MSNSDNGSAPGDSKPSGSGSGKGRSEKGSANHIIWYILMVAAVAGGVDVWISKQTQTVEISAGEVEKGLNDGTFTSDNVFKLTFGKEYLTCQNQREGAQTQREGAEKGATTEKEKSEPVKKYAVPLVGSGEIDRNKLKELAQQKGIATAYDRPPSDLPSIIYFVAFPVLMVVLFFMILRRTGGGGAGPPFGARPPAKDAQEKRAITVRPPAGGEQHVAETPVDCLI